MQCNGIAARGLFYRCKAELKIRAALILYLLYMPLSSRYSSNNYYDSRPLLFRSRENSNFAPEKRRGAHSSYGILPLSYTGINDCQHASVNSPLRLLYGRLIVPSSAGSLFLSPSPSSKEAAATHFLFCSLHIRIFSYQHFALATIPPYSYYLVLSFCNAAITYVCEQFINCQQLYTYCVRDLFPHMKLTISSHASSDNHMVYMISTAQRYA